MRARIAEMKTSEAEIARRVDISARRFSYYANDEREPDYEMLLKICDVLSVSPDYLLGFETAEQHLGNTADLPEDMTERVTVEIPEYDVRASMGDGFAVDRENIKDQWTFSRRYLVDELRLTLRNLVVIEVVGDSMEPTLRSGDRVLVDMGDRRISNPGIFVLWDGDGTVAKRLELVPNSKPQKLMRISDNPQHGRYEVLAEETVIIGRIVWFARRL